MSDLTIRDCAEQTLDGTLPYEETWRSNAISLIVAINALERIKAQQPETLRMIESNGFVFDSIGNEPGNWQHLAFSVYTDLCQVDTYASQALKDMEP